MHEPQSALDTASCDTGDDLVRQENIDRYGGHEYNDYGCKHTRPVTGVHHGSHRLIKTYPDRTQLGLVGEDQGHEVLVPLSDKVKDGDCDHRRLGQREDDCPEALDRAAAIDCRRFLIGGRDAVEKRHQKVGRIGNGAGCIQEDQRKAGPGQVQCTDNREQRHDNHDSGDRQSEDEHFLHHAVAKEFEAGQAVSRRRMMRMQDGTV